MMLLGIFNDEGNKESLFKSLFKISFKNKKEQKIVGRLTKMEEKLEKKIEDETKNRKEMEKEMERKLEKIGNEVKTLMKIKEGKKEKQSNGSASIQPLEWKIAGALINSRHGHDDFCYWISDDKKKGVAAVADGVTNPFGSQNNQNGNAPQTNINHRNISGAISYLVSKKFVEYWKKELEKNGSISEEKIKEYLDSIGKDIGGMTKDVEIRNIIHLKSEKRRLHWQGKEFISNPMITPLCTKKETTEAFNEKVEENENTIENWDGATTLLGIIFNSNVLWTIICGDGNVIFLKKLNDNWLKYSIVLKIGLTIGSSGVATSFSFKNGLRGAPFILKQIVEEYDGIFISTDGFSLREHFENLQNGLNNLENQDISKIPKEILESSFPTGAFPSDDVTLLIAYAKHPEN